MGKTKKRWKRQRVGSMKGGKASGVVSFNWASGSGTHSDNIKGQIYIKHCWEMSARKGKGRRAERRGEERRPRKAIGSRYITE